MNNKKVEIAIIGTGSAGMKAYREASKKTDSIILIEGNAYGTTCARVGCMPSKVLLQVAEDYHRRFSLEEQGIQGSEGLSIDDVKVMKHVRKLRDRFVRAVIEDIDSWKESHLVQAYATIIDSNTLIEALGVPFPSANKGLKIVSSILFVTFSLNILCQEFVSS